MCEKWVSLFLKILQFAGVVAVIIVSGAADYGALAQSKETDLPMSDNFRAAQDLFTDNNRIIDLVLKLDTPVTTESPASDNFRAAQDLFTDNNKIIDLVLKLDTPDALALDTDGQIGIAEKSDIGLRYKLPLGQKKR